MDQAELQNPSLAALAIANGKMPEAGGLISVNNDERPSHAYDLVGGELEGNKLRLLPADKSAVDEQTDRILQPGLITLSDRNEVKIIGKAVDTKTLEWDKTLRRHSRFNSQGILVVMLGLDALTYEIDELEGESVVTKPRTKLY